MIACRGGPDGARVRGLPPEEPQRQESGEDDEGVAERPRDLVSLEIHREQREDVAHGKPGHERHDDQSTHVWPRPLCAAVLHPSTRAPEEPDVNQGQGDPVKQHDLPPERGRLLPIHERRRESKHEEPAECGKDGCVHGAV